MQKKKLHLIEDIAGAFGGKIGNKYFGGFADFVVGSFGQGKILDMNGGGFLALRNKVIFNKAKLNCALLEKYNYVNKNLNIQIHKIQSGIINKKINKTAFNKRNLKNFLRLSFIIKNLANSILKN